MAWVCKPSRVPAEVIRIPLEGAPQILSDWHRASDDERMLDWLFSKPRLLEVVGEAIEIATEAEACR